MSVSPRIFKAKTPSGCGWRNWPRSKALSLPPEMSSRECIADFGFSIDTDQSRVLPGNYMRSLIFLLAATVFIFGCLSSTQPRVVVYSALDREFAEPVLNDFTQAAGIRVLAKYDDESTK